MRLTETGRRTRLISYQWMTKDLSVMQFRTDVGQLLSAIMLDRDFLDRDFIV